MSVNQRQYIVYGVKLPYSEYEHLSGTDEDRFDELDIVYKKDRDVGLIIDGMDGKYCIAGKILIEAGGVEEWGWLGEGAQELPKLKPAERRRIEAKVTELLGRPEKLRYLIINHWT